MPSPSEPEKKDKTKSVGSHDVFYRRPDVALLSQEHWSYIQKRYHLSPRELQVAELVCKGFSNEEIAKDLKIKHGTVKTHLRNIYRRTRVKNKITMLLNFVDQANKFSGKPSITPRIPIVDIKKPSKKTSVPAENK